MTSGVRVRIQENDIANVMPIMDEMLGHIEKFSNINENSILVPIDFSDYSQKAALAAFEIAHTLDAKLILYHLIRQPDFYTIPSTEFISYDPGLSVKLEEREKEANDKFNAFVAELIGILGEENWYTVKSESIIKVGVPEYDLLAYAKKHPPRMIVMGIKGQDTTKEDLMGATTAEMIAHAKVPVLAIPEEAPGLEQGKLKKIVYATNFDERDFVALSKLIGLLKPFHAKLFCLHVNQGESREWDEAKLQGMKKFLKEKHGETDVECVILDEGNILDELEIYIRINQIDILALTTHKRNLITRIFNPSIAREMAFHTKIPLLIFHASSK